MSGGHFHVHGPHDHELEHSARHGERDDFSSRIAVTTAILATLGALCAYQGGATQANASLFKNNAAIKKTEAANQWGYYQAKSSKQNIAELGAVIASGEASEKYRGEVARYAQEKTEIKAAAERLEGEAKNWDAKSDAEIHLHHRWAQATTGLQIAIALSAIALLTRKKWLLWGVYGVAGLGAVLGGLAVAQI
jgi:ABC-type multidrug transport system fused ATPase/permease subunit